MPEFPAPSRVPAPHPRRGDVCHSGAVDLRTWITADLAAVRTRFRNGIVAHVPAEQWTTRLGAITDASDLAGGRT